MKKLSKINFKDASLLNENEMKHVFGGSGSTSEGGGLQAALLPVGVVRNQLRLLVVMGRARA